MPAHRALCSDILLFRVKVLSRVFRRAFVRVGDTILFSSRHRPLSRSTLRYGRGEAKKNLLVLPRLECRSA